MSELRKDPITGRWVIMATERARRPKDFVTKKPARQDGTCPFCPGHEGMTPPEILAYRLNGSNPNSAGWSVRVVPNRYPALRIEGGLDRRGEGMFDRMNGIGAHEVIIETPDHHLSLGQMEVEHVAGVLRAYRERSLDLRKDERFQYILIFRNHGEVAGASLEHPHSQLIATPVVPKRVQEEMRSARQYHELRERCLLCDVVHEEIEVRKRVILENEEFLVITPFASRFPFETWVLPKRHQSDFAACGDEEMLACAKVLREVLKRTAQVLDDPPYNLVLHTAPLREYDTNMVHWWFEIMPRLTQVAGFEWGSGFYINPTLPEEAAEYLRNAS